MTRAQVHYLLKAIEVRNKKDMSSKTQLQPDPEIKAEDQEWRNNTLKRMSDMIDNKNTELFG